MEGRLALPQVPDPAVLQAQVLPEAVGVGEDGVVAGQDCGGGPGEVDGRLLLRVWGCGVGGNGGCCRGRGSVVDCRFVDLGEADGFEVAEEGPDWLFGGIVFDDEGFDSGESGGGDAAEDVGSEIAGAEDGERVGRKIDVYFLVEEVAGSGEGVEVFEERGVGVQLEDDQGSKWNDGIVDQSTDLRRYGEQIERAIEMAWERAVERVGDT